MKKARTYIKRLHVDLNGFRADYEELPDVEDFRKITETTAVSEEYVMRLLDMRAF